VGGTKEIPHESTLKPSVTLSAIETSVTHWTHPFQNTAEAVTDF
jgi:hypothetical protein